MDTDPQLIAKRREHERLITTYVLLGALLAGVLVVIGLKLEYNVKLFSGLAWGFALYASGVLLGFLFAIPRVAANGGVAGASAPKPGADTATAPAESSARKSSVNSNLVEVSDWLTKIIVGVGLVELQNLGSLGQSLATFAAGSFGACDPGTSSACKAAYIPVAGAIALYFGVLGFITGYLLTRMFLAILMSLADRDADKASSEFELPSGTKSTLTDVVTNLSSDMADVQTHLKSLIDDDSRNKIAPTAPLKNRSVVWVDDRPYRNVLTIDRLKRSGVTVRSVSTNQEALALLTRSPTPAVLISDMYRDEDNQPDRPAGLVLLQAVASRLQGDAPDRLRFLVFCSKSSAQKHEAAAKAGGADLVTASTTDLVAALETLFGELES